ncbi:MAG: carboxypeptidase regulatory-like domain-containing protein [Polaromonas sp.]
MNTLIHRAALATLLGALTAGSAFAQASSPLPPVRSSGSVQYLSGGIGVDESAAIRSASAQWPLTLEFAIKGRQRADFAADVTVRVRDTRGQDVLQATSEGPFLLARLAPGSYTVEATLGGQTLQRKVEVKSGQSAKEVFLWAADADKSRP